MQRPSSQEWPEVLAAHRGWLGTVILARVGDGHAVEEVMQETALAAARNCHASDLAGIARWLYRVAVRQSLLYRRRTGRQARRLRNFGEAQHIDANHGASSADDPGSRPERWAIVSEQQGLVQMALTQIPRGDREVLLLKYVEDWSCREIAERIGVSESAVKSRLLRARNLMRNELLRLNQDWELP